jgi:hypothetical protein
VRERVAAQFAIRLELELIILGADTEGTAH